MLIAYFSFVNSALLWAMILDGGLIILSIILGFLSHGNMGFYLLFKRFQSTNRLSSL